MVYRTIDQVVQELNLLSERVILNKRFIEANYHAYRRAINLALKQGYETGNHPNQLDEYASIYVTLLLGKEEFK